MLCSTLARFFVHHSTERVLANQLSPGERVRVMSLLWEFVVDGEQMRKTVLLFDEPDAHVHPDAVHSLCAFFKSQFDRGAQIVVTSHRATTVQMLTRIGATPLTVVEGVDGSRFMRELDTVSACTMLNGDSLMQTVIPFKHVLVEGNDDKLLYSAIYAGIGGSDALFHVHGPKTGSNDTSNSGEIKRHLGLFNSSDKHWSLEAFFTGIIDNDNCNRDDGDLDSRTLITGLYWPAQRYSIENYFLDPLVLSALARAKFLTFVTEYNFVGSNSQEIVNLWCVALGDVVNRALADTLSSQERGILDYAIDKGGIDGWKRRSRDCPRTEILTSLNNGTTIEVVLQNKEKVNYPTWILEMRGHDLLAAVCVVLKVRQFRGLVKVVLDNVNHGLDWMAQDIVHCVREAASKIVPRHQQSIEHEDHDQFAVGQNDDPPVANGTVAVFAVGAFAGFVICAAISGLRVFDRR